MGMKWKLKLAGIAALAVVAAGARATTLEITPVAEPRPGDVPHYASDCARLFARTEWRPKRSPRTVLEDTYAWILANEDSVLPTLVNS